MNYLFLAIAIGLICYTVYLRNVIDHYRTDFNDIFDRIRFWRKGGCLDEKGYWLLGDIAGIIARRQGYNHATVQRRVPKETGDESAD